MRHFFIPLLILLMTCASGYGEDEVRQALIRDITSIEGVRENPVISDRRGGWTAEYGR